LIEHTVSTTCKEDPLPNLAPLTPISERTLPVQDEEDLGDHNELLAELRRGTRSPL